MENLKLVGVVTLLGVPLLAVYHLAGEAAAWWVTVPVLLIAVAWAARAWRDCERTRRAALREVEEARRRWPAEGGGQ